MARRGPCSRSTSATGSSSQPNAQSSPLEMPDFSPAGRRPQGRSQLAGSKSRPTTRVKIAGAVEPGSQRRMGRTRQAGRTHAARHAAMPAARRASRAASGRSTPDRSAWRGDSGSRLTAHCSPTPASRRIVRAPARAGPEARRGVPTAVGKRRPPARGRARAA